MRLSTGAALRLLSSVAAALAGLARPAAGQHELEASTPRHVVSGRVLEPDGSPAPGAVVVTSAGGSAVTGMDGSFELVVALPLDAESIEVTAVAHERTGSRSLVASARIVPAALSPTTTVGTLALTPSLDCYSRWQPTFGGKQGPNGDVTALAVFDDGSGPALFASGPFNSAGGFGAVGIAKWDGSRWSALGRGFFERFAGLQSANVLCVHDDGSGQALFAGGNFTSAGGSTANGIAKWDGAAWSSLGGGMSHMFRRPEVHALAVFDDGSGPALYAGGLFQAAGGVAASNIAKWNGSSWSALGSGIDWEGVRALAVFDDGNGPALYAGGDFTTAGGVAASRIARWDGSSWSALGTGTNGAVHALIAHDDGSGPALFAGGVFATAGAVAANRVARWNGSTWSAVGTHPNMPIVTLTVFDDGSGPALYAGGFLAFGATTTSVEKWDGALWSVVGTVNDDVEALAVYDDGSGPTLWAGGGFTSVSGAPAGRIARWNGSIWSAPGSASFIDSSVLALAVHDDGSGPALYAGGGFASAGGVPANRIAKWNGSTWSALGSGLQGGFAFPDVHALIVFDDGGGPALYAGGDFGIAGGVSAKNVAKWDGASWSALGSGVGHVNALAGFDDGTGPALYAGGSFAIPGNRIARWSGATWSALGSGLDGEVQTLAVFDDGGGPALYAGGSFTSAGGVPASKIAKWDGTTWSALGSGMDEEVLALAVFDDGSGPALYAGGWFRTAGGVTSNRIARWDGSSWTALGGGFQSSVYSLVVHDDGAGMALHAGGQMGKRVAKWSGSSWTALGIGIDGAVRAFASWDDGEGTALYAGGQFFSSPAGDSFLAKRGCKPKETVERRKL